MVPDVASLIRATALRLCHAASFPRHVLPELWRSSSSRKRRAQGRPGAGRTRRLVCRGSPQIECTPGHRFGRNDRPSLRNGVTAYTCSPRRAGLVGRRHPQSLASLIPASGDQDHTASPSAPASPVVRNQRVHRIPQPTCRDDRDTPLCEARDGCTITPICISGKANYFCVRGLT